MEKRNPSARNRDPARDARVRGLRSVAALAGTTPSSPLFKKMFPGGESILPKFGYAIVVTILS